jgi:hypothetical protein
MKEITIQIPDAKVDFFLELLDKYKLGVQVGKIQEDDMVIPEFHKAIVMERIKRYEDDPTRILKWDKVRKDFKLV